MSLCRQKQLWQRRRSSNNTYWASRRKNWPTYWSHRNVSIDSAKSSWKRYELVFDTYHDTGYSGFQNRECSLCVGFVCSCFLTFEGNINIGAILIPTVQLFYPWPLSCLAWQNCPHNLSNHPHFILFPFFFSLPGVEREPVDSKAREAGVVDPSEGMPAADAGRRRGQPAQETEAVLRAAVSPVQAEDAAGSPQPGTGPAQRGESFIGTQFHIYLFWVLYFPFIINCLAVVCVVTGYCALYTMSVCLYNVCMYAWFCGRSATVY